MYHDHHLAANFARSILCTLCVDSAPIQMAGFRAKKFLTISGIRSQARTNSHDEYVARGNSAGSVVIIISGT